MPFTVSHIAAILPFVWRRAPRAPLAPGALAPGALAPGALPLAPPARAEANSSLSEIQDFSADGAVEAARTGVFPPSALAIGAMVPDFPALLPIGVPRDVAHSVLGAVTVDLGLGLVLFAVWALVLRAPLLDYAPAWVRTRVSPDIGWPGASAPRASTPGASATLASVALLIAAILIGIATHLVIDGFTHEGWLTDLLPVLLNPIAGYPGVVWLHLLFSVIGLGVLAWWAVVWTRVTPAGPRRPGRVGRRERGILTRVVVGLFAALALGIWFAGISAGIPPVDESLLFIALTASIGTAGSAAVLVCLAWHARRLRERR